MLLYIQTGKRPLRYLKGGHIMKKHKTMIWGLEMAFLVIAVSSCGNDGHIKQTESTMTVSVNENVPIIETEDIETADTLCPP